MHHKLEFFLIINLLNWYFVAHFALVFACLRLMKGPVTLFNPETFVAIFDVFFTDCTFIISGNLLSDNLPWQLPITCYIVILCVF